MLVGCIASFLEYQVSSNDGPAKLGGFDPYGGEDDYGDYGDDYGSGDEYVTEDIGKAKHAFGDMGMGMMPDLMQDDFGEDDFFGDEDRGEENRDQPGSSNESEEAILIGDLMSELEDPSQTKREVLADIMRHILKQFG